MSEAIKEILDDYKKLAGEITEKLDNTVEYESWLIIQDYVDEFLNYITSLQKENENLLYEINGYLEEKKKLKIQISARETVNEKASNFLNHLREAFDENDEMYELLGSAIDILKGGGE